MKESLAYEAMFKFLEDRYSRLPSEELGSLLGDMQLAPDGIPFDPAVVKDWEDAVEAVQQSRSIRVTESLRIAS